MTCFTWYRYTTQSYHCSLYNFPPFPYTCYSAVQHTLYRVSLCTVILPTLDVLIWPVPLSHQTVYSLQLLSVSVCNTSVARYSVCSPAITSLAVCPLYRHTNLSAPPISCLSALMIHRPCITVPSQFFFKHSSNFARICIMPSFFVLLLWGPPHDVTSLSSIQSSVSPHSSPSSVRLAPDRLVAAKWSGARRRGRQATGELNTKLRDGTARRAEGPWSSTLHPVPKKDSRRWAVWRNGGLNRGKRCDVIRVFPYIFHCNTKAVILLQAKDIIWKNGRQQIRMV